jgi:hypothetical protein
MKPPASRSIRAAAAWLLLVSVQACRAGRSAAPPTLRLVDRFKAEAVTGREDKPAPALPRVEWRFDGPAADPEKPTRGWSAVADIKDLGVRAGRLAGRAAGKSPILRVEREPSRDADLLHAIEVRLRVSAGQNMAVAFSDDEKPDLDRARQQARDYPNEGSTPIVAGEEMRRIRSVGPRASPPPRSGTSSCARPTAQARHSRSSRSASCSGRNISRRFRPE